MGNTMSDETMTAFGTPQGPSNAARLTEYRTTGDEVYMELVEAGADLSYEQARRIRSAMTVQEALRLADEFGVPDRVVAEVRRKIQQELRQEGTQLASASTEQLRTAVEASSLSDVQKGAMLGILNEGLPFEEAVAAMLDDEQIEPFSVASVVVDVDGGISAYEQAGGNEIAGFDYFSGENRNGVSLLLNGGETQAVGNIAGLLNVRGPAVVRLSMSKAQGVALGIQEGEETDVVLQMGEDGSSTSVRAIVYFADSDNSAVVEGATRAGTIPPGEIRLDDEGNPVDPENEWASIFEDALSQAGIEEFLGTSEPVEVQLPPLPYAPYESGGTILVKPVFRAEDAEQMFLRMAPDEAYEWQLMMEQAGLAPAGSADASGGWWSGEWVGRMQLMMAYSNLHGYATPGDLEGNVNDFRKLSALRRVLNDYEARPVESIPEFLPPTRKMPSSAELEVEVRNVFLDRLGQEPTRRQIVDFSNYLRDKWGEFYDASELVNERDWVQERVAEGYNPSDRQRQLLDDNEVVVPNPAAEMQRYFQQQFGRTIAQRDQFAEERSERADLWDSVSMMRRISGG